MKPHLFAAALAALGIGSLTASLAQDKPVPTRLGFIDMNKAYETYRKRKELTDALGDKKKDILAQLKKRAKAIDEKTDSLNTMNPGTPKYVETERDISIAKYVLDLDQKQLRSDLEDEQRKKFAAIYKEICQEADAYGAEHGLAAVFLYFPPDFDFGANFELFSDTRAVLCRDAQLDVTKEVVERLNAQLPPAPVKTPAPVAPPEEPKKDK
jgi:Skp family chaperone for outer membrane proteins